MQRVGGLTEVPETLRRFGVDPVGVLAVAGLSSDALDSFENRIPFARAVTLLGESCRATRCDHFGLLIGKQWKLGHMGLIGELMRQCPTIGEALRTHVVNQRLYSQGIAAYLFEYTSSAQFGFTIFHPDVDDTACIYDVTTAAIVSGISEMCGGDWHASEVHLPRARPQDVRPYREFYRCEVRFDADRASVHFPRQVLQRPIVGADPARYDMLEREASERVDQQLLPALYRALRLLMLEGDPSLPSVARQFDMHHRTLDRRLRLQGTSFKRVLEEVRYEAAREMLSGTRRSVAEIGAALGYSEDSAFVRAFKRWSGTTPGLWREGNSQLDR
jgi:AraC-like DNA-binding protein